MNTCTYDKNLGLEWRQFEVISRDEKALIYARKKKTFVVGGGNNNKVHDLSFFSSNLFRVNDVKIFLSK